MRDNQLSWRARRAHPVNPGSMVSPLPRRFVADTSALRSQIAQPAEYSPSLRQHSAIAARARGAGPYRRP